MSADALADLFAAARAADSACAGCALLAPGESRPDWLIAERADGLRVRLDGVGAQSAAVAAVLALDLSAEAAAARAVQRARAAAVTAFLTSNDPVTVAARALFRLAFTWINDERESRGAARILEPDIIALALSGTLNDGLGDAPVLPAPPPSAP